MSKHDDKSRAHWLRIGAALAAVAVAAGAFGAHGLREVLTPERLATWRTAANYQLIHAVALVALAGAPAALIWGRRLLLAGILVFSGSLYVLCLTDIGWFGAITPIGGLSLIAGWIMVGIGSAR